MRRATHLFFFLGAFAQSGDDAEASSTPPVVLGNNSVVPRFPAGLTSAPFPGAVRATHVYTGAVSDGDTAYPLVGSSAGPLHVVFTDDMPVKPTPNPVFAPPHLDVLCTAGECPTQLAAFAPQAAPQPPDGALAVDPWLPPQCNPATNAATAACGAQLRSCLASHALAQCDSKHSLNQKEQRGLTLVDAVLADLKELDSSQSARKSLRTLFLSSLQSDFVGAELLFSLADRILADNALFAVADGTTKKTAELNLAEAIECWKVEFANPPIVAACKCYNAHGKCWRAAAPGCFDSLPKADVEHCFNYLACSRAQCEGSGAAAAAATSAALLAAAGAVFVALRR
jgi:hypothetical protein